MHRLTTHYLLLTTYYKALEKMRRAELASDAAYDRDDYERDEVSLPQTLTLTLTLALTLTLTLTRTRCTCARAEAARSCSRASVGS